MIDVLEVILFYVATFGAFYGVGGFISDLLDKAGWWPIEKETTQKPRSISPLEAFNSDRRYSPTPKHTHGL